MVVTNDKKGKGTTGETQKKFQPYIRNKGVNGSTALKFEDMKIGVKYAFTFNPEYQPQDLNEVKKWYRFMYDSFVMFKNGVEVTLWPESSPTGRMHFHGILKVIDFYEYFNFVKYFVLRGHYDLDTIEEEKGKQSWQDYCSKQESIWKKYFEDTSVGYPLSVNSRSLYVDLHSGDKIAKVTTKKNILELLDS